MRRKPAYFENLL